MKRNRQATAYWLIPDASSRELFRELVRILSRQFKAPRFTPHVTLLIVPGKSTAPRQVLQAVRAARFHLRVRGIGTSGKFTKTLFVRLAPNPALRGLVAQIGRAAGRRPARLADPHLSLLYKKLSPAVKRELARTIKLPMRRIRFDSVAVVRCAFPTRTAAEVRRWKKVAGKSLAT